MSNHLDFLGSYGFRWGPMAVWRIAQFKRRHAVGVSTEYHRVEVIVSPTGRNIQVYLDGRKMT